MRLEALLLALACGSALAQPTLGVHLGTWHPDRTMAGGTYGVSLASEDVAGGAYCNSYSRSERNPRRPGCVVSVYAGRVWRGPEWHGLRPAVVLGAVSGYVSRPLVMPMVAASVGVGPFRLVYTPSARRGAQGLTLIVEVPISSRDSMGAR